MLITSLLFFKDFLTNTSLPRRAGCQLSTESISALAGQTMILNLQFIQKNQNIKLLF